MFTFSMLSFFARFSTSYMGFEVFVLYTLCVAGSCFHGGRECILTEIYTRIAHAEWKANPACQRNSEADISSLLFAEIKSHAFSSAFIPCIAHSFPLIHSIKCHMLWLLCSFYRIRDA